jgi:hypothetical protein
MVRFTIIWALLIAFHPVHVSLASLEYEESAGMFSMFVKVYSDDLENDCRLVTGNSELLLYESGYKPDGDILQEYIKDRISITIDNKLLVGEIERIEADQEEVRINIKYIYKGDATNIIIKNRIMTDLFDDQTNLFIIRMGDWEEGIKFTTEYTEHIINRIDKSY